MFFDKVMHKLSTRYSSFFGTEYGVFVRNISGNVEVDLEVSERNSTMMHLCMKNDTEVSEFVAALERAKNKYVEWKAVAQKNGIRNYTNRMPISFPEIQVRWEYMGKSYSSKGDMWPIFHISEDGTFAFIVRVKAREERVREFAYMEQYFALSSESEFNNLIEDLRVERIKEFLNKRDAINEMLKW